MSLKQKLTFILALIIGWLIPGGGFGLLRRPIKAVILLGLISLLIVSGMFLADFRDIRFQDNPFYYLGKFGNGLVWLSCYLFMSYTPRGWVSLKYSEVGLLYICVAGALNIVILISLITTANKYFVSVPAETTEALHTECVQQEVPEGT